MKAQPRIIALLGGLAATLLACSSWAGPYSAGSGDPTNPYDAPVPGYTGPGGDGAVVAENTVNPIFFGWATRWFDYFPTAGVALAWSNPDLALNFVTGDNFDIVSLGDLNSTQLSGNLTPGRITLGFAKPIQNLSGADFVIYENALGLAGSVFAELAYVEVSSDGTHFARFPSRSLTTAAVGPYGNVDPSNVFNLAGKHINGMGQSWGTPFDLAQLAGDPLVLSGQVDLNNIQQVRLVDIPGNGSFLDSTGAGIYDAWVTIGSGGLDLEAIGVISQAMTYAEWAAQRGLAGTLSGPGADADGDGLTNLREYAHGRVPDWADNNQAPLQCAMVADSGGNSTASRLQVTFVRDERAQDLVYEIQASNNGLQNWTTIARSTGGGPMTGVNGFSPSITETAATGTASVGVLRLVSLADTENAGARTSRFLRLVVTQAPAGP
ncbi:MAG: hypothetical protein SFU85_03005 [Candidatus Methylacidiphilales bacterium]|nr:hypothetical protein [Candidatus Methylacidiphilales bacterium]